METNSNLVPPGAARGKCPGFTLIEIILVLAIVALLLSVGIANFGNIFSGGQATKARADLASLNSVLKSYLSDCGRYPTTAQGLGALQERPDIAPRPRRWAGPYMDVFPRDPWDKPYRYRYPGTRNPAAPDLFSSGPDGEVGTDDDIWLHEREGDVKPWEER